MGLIIHLWYCQCKEDSSCGNFGETGSGVVGVLEALAVAGVMVTTNKCSSKV